jgi:hypothetical protein
MFLQDFYRTESASSIAVPGARCLYIRSYQMKIGTLISILEDWTERGYASNECAVWPPAPTVSQSLTKTALVYLRYVKQ